MSDTWSDEDSEDESEKEITNSVMVFTGKLNLIVSLVMKTSLMKS